MKIIESHIIHDEKGFLRTQYVAFLTSTEAYQVRKGSANKLPEIVASRGELVAADEAEVLFLRLAYNYKYDSETI